MLAFDFFFNLQRMALQKIFLCRSGLWLFSTNTSCLRAKCPAVSFLQTNAVIHLNKHNGKWML